MRERASKSFGAPSMSKFVEENERKRIQRLHSIKSSFQGQGRCTTAKNFSDKTRKKRPSAAGKGDNTDRGAFQLRNLCGASAKTTRSGLRVPVAGCEAAMKSDELEAIKDNVSRANKNIRLRTRANVAERTEGKENCSPNDKQTPNCITRGIPGRIDNSTRSYDDRLITKRTNAQRTKSTFITRDTPNFNGKATQQKDRWRKTCSTSVLESSALERIERERPKGATADKTRLKVRKPYVNRGVTVESLENEREEANKMLQELDDANLIGKMKEMQIVMDVTNTQKRRDDIDMKPLVFKDEYAASNAELRVKSVSDSCSTSQNEDCVNSMPYETDSWISECSLSSFCGSSSSYTENDWEFYGEKEDCISEEKLSD